MNTFGGNWTENKIEILVEYARAYLTIMNTYATQFGWKLMYFDGFAGSGLIVKGEDENRKEIVGAALRIKLTSLDLLMSIILLRCMKETLKHWNELQNQPFLAKPFTRLRRIAIKN